MSTTRDSRNGTLWNVVPRAPGQSALMPVNFTTLPHFSVSAASEARVDLPGEFVDDFGSRVFGCAKSQPGTRLVSRHKITNGRNFRKRFRTHCRRHRQGAEFAGPDVFDRRGHGGEHDLHLPRDGCVPAALSSALVLWSGQLHLNFRLEIDQPPLSGPGGMLVQGWPLRQRGRRSRSA